MIMWAIVTPVQTIAGIVHESDARHYIARQYPTADRIGVYSWRDHGADISIKHSS